MQHMKHLRFFVPIAFLFVLLLTLAFPNAAAASTVRFHFWGASAVLIDSSSVFTDTACDTGSGLPLSGGTLDTNSCHAAVLDSTDFGRSFTVGNVHYGNTCPSSLTPDAGASCQFYQVILSAVYGHARVATTSGKTKGQVRDDITAQGVSLDVFKTVITTSALNAVLQLSSLVGIDDHDNDCVIRYSATNPGVQCTVTLTNPVTSQSSISWSVPNIHALVFSPSSGTISPGGSQIVTITLLPEASCTPETVNFDVAGDGAATMTFGCDSTNLKGTLKITDPTSQPVISGTPASTTTHVRTLLLSNEIDTTLLAKCGLHKGGNISSSAQATSSVHYNDLLIREGGFLDHFSPSGAANQSLAISATSPNVGVLLTFNEQRSATDGGVAYISSTAIHIVVTNSDGQVIGNWSVNQGFAAIHCAKHLDQAESIPNA